MKMRRIDFIIIASLIVISVVAVILLFLFQKDGNRVIVEKDGQIIAEYSLESDGEYILNGGKNILVIEDGRAYMKEATCPDGTCVRKGKISHVGESITCLPNKTHIYIVGNGDDILVS